MLPLSHILILASIVFSIGIVGIFLNRKNLIVLIMSIELMLLAVNMNWPGILLEAQDMMKRVIIQKII